MERRTCADGIKERSWNEEVKTASPAVRTDSVMIASAIEIHEGRVVGTDDIKGAYPRANQDDFTVTRFTDEQAGIARSMNE